VDEAISSVIPVPAGIRFFHRSLDNYGNTIIICREVAGGTEVRMAKIEAIKQKIEKQKSFIMERYNVKSIGIFGSYARGEERTDGDIDILVEFQQPIGIFAFMDLEEYLTVLIGIKVDLVSKKALKPRIGKHILQEVVYV